MASETTKFQVNFKTSSGSLINLYADSIIDGMALLNEFAGAIPLIKEAEAALAGAPAPASTPAAAPAWTPAPASHPSFEASTGTSGRTCKHGAMTYREGAGAKGPWKGYFCPTPKGTPDQCDAQFIRG